MLTGAALLLALLAVPALAQAASNADLAAAGDMGADEIAEVLGLPDRNDGIGEAECQLTPANPGDITKESAKKLSVGINGTTFTFDHAYFHDRTGADDSTDFIFTPELDGKRLVSPAFVYRTGERAQSNGFIVGLRGDYTPTTADGYELDDEFVAGRCSNFNGSEFAKALDAVAGEDNLDDLNVAGRTTLSDSTSAFSGGDDSNPLAQALQWAAGLLSALNLALVSAISSVMDLSNLTDVQGLTNAWTVVRDLVNLLFFVVFAALAVATIVRIDVKNYNIRQSLPLLIFAIIAVNFGLLFARVLVDTAFVLSQPFLHSAQAIVQNVATNDPAGAASDTDIGTAMVMLFASLIMTIGLIILLFFFVIRIIVVWILAALSPIIFVFMVLPLTRGESSNLLSTWIKWVYMAPIAFLILYIGSAMLLPAFGDNQSSDSGANAILSAIFYAGVLGAAVMVPYGLGGGIMKMAAGRGTTLASGAGKGGLAAAGIIPGVAEGRRTLAAFGKARETAQQERAQERAVAMSSRLYGQLGEGGLAAGITGLDTTRAQQYRDQLVDKEQKNQQLGGVGADGALRAIQYKSGQLPASALSKEELAIANDHIGELAAWKTVVDSNFVDPNGPELARYARYGLHRSSADPLVASVKKSYTGGDIGGHIDQDTLKYGLQYANAETFGKFPGTFWNTIDSGQFAASNPVGSRILRDKVQQFVDPSGLQKAFDNTDRARASKAKREAIGRAYRYFGDDVQRALRQANLNSYTDAKQHVQLADRTRTQLEADYHAQFGKDVKKGHTPDQF